MIEPDHPELSIGQQCKLLSIARSSFYYTPKGETGSETKTAIRNWMAFYNHQRPHSALDGKPPALVYWQKNDISQPDQQVQRVA